MNQSIVFFDGVCNLCSGSVQFIIRHDKRNKFRFSSLQGDLASKTLSGNAIKHLDSIVLRQNNKLYTRSTAALKIAAGLSFPINLLYIFIIVPPFIRNFVYDYIAKNRYRWFGKMEACWLPSPELKSKFID